MGLGYTGLPLALQFGKYFNTLGFDINLKKIKDLNNLIDTTNETHVNDIKKFLKKINLLATREIFQKLISI